MKELAETSDGETPAKKNRKRGRITERGTIPPKRTRHTTKTRKITMVKQSNEPPRFFVPTKIGYGKPML